MTVWSYRQVDQKHQVFGKKGFKRFMLLVCAGTCVTDTQRDDLCVCYEVNKKSSYVTVYAYKYLHEKGNMLFHNQYTKKGMYGILSSIKDWVGISTTVLFQHPSPSKITASENALAVSGRDCSLAL